MSDLGLPASVPGAEPPEGITPQDVIDAYRLILGRDPESEQVVLHHLAFATRGALGVALIRSAEARARHGLVDPPPEPLTREPLTREPLTREHMAPDAAAPADPGPQPPGLAAAADTLAEAALPAADRALLRRFAADSRAPSAGFVTDFLGVRTRCDLSPALAGCDGKSLGIPYGGDLHGPVEAWLGLLDAVVAAQERFRMLCLGAFWGRWPAAAHAAAQRQGLKRIRLYAVEADAARFDLLRRHLADNNLTPQQHVVINAAVTPHPGTATWPLLADPLAADGRRPLTRTEAAGRPTVAVPAMALGDLLSREPEWDLVRMDLESIEPSVCTTSLDALNRRVRRLIIGTRSRTAEGALIVILVNAGWRLEREQPCRMAWRNDADALEDMTTADGVQVWRNPLLA